MFELKLNFLINPIWSTKETDQGFIFTHQQKTVYFEDVDRIGFELLKVFIALVTRLKKHVSL